MIFGISITGKNEKNNKKRKSYIYFNLTSINCATLCCTHILSDIFYTGNLQYTKSYLFILNIISFRKRAFEEPQMNFLRQICI